MNCTFVFLLSLRSEYLILFGARFAMVFCVKDPHHRAGVGAELSVNFELLLCRTYYLYFFIVFILKKFLRGVGVQATETANFI